MSRSELMKVACIDCGEVGKLRKIVYGMPSDDFDFEKYAVGGCIIEDDAPDVECRKCGVRWKL